MATSLQERGEEFLNDSLRLPNCVTSLLFTALPGASGTLLLPAHGGSCTSGTWMILDSLLHFFSSLRHLLTQNLPCGEEFMLPCSSSKCHRQLYLPHQGNPHFLPAEWSNTKLKLHVLKPAQSVPFPEQPPALAEDMKPLRWPPISVVPELPRAAVLFTVSTHRQADSVFPLAEQLPWKQSHGRRFSLLGTNTGAKSDMFYVTLGEFLGWKHVVAGEMTPFAV